MVNKTLKDIPITLRLEDAPGTIIEAENRDILVKKKAQGHASFFIVLPKSYLSTRKTTLTVRLYEGIKKITELKTNFMGPFRKVYPSFIKTEPL